MSGRFAVSTLVVGANGPGDDRAICIDHGAGVLLLVVDGAGGTRRGAVAADAIVAILREEATGLSEGPPDLVRWIVRADHQLARECDGGQAAAVVAFVTEAGISGASVGDCGAWLVSATDYVDLTERQSRKPLLGSGSATVTTFEQIMDGTLLLATDGLLKYAPADRLCGILRGAPIDGIPAALVDLVRLRSGRLQDDVGLIVAMREMRTL